MTPEPIEPRERWQAPAAGRRYATARWSSVRRRERDPRLVGGLLARFAGPPGVEPLLDAPCGSGRLRPALARHGSWVGLDVSLSMLREARSGGAPAALLCGDLERLPFRDGAFRAVVCCRLLHHLREPASLERVLRELVRVTDRLLIASFWDRATLGEWRRRAFSVRRERARLARSRSEIAAALLAAGAEVVAWRHSLRFVSRQTFVVARKRAP